MRLAGSNGTVNETAVAAAISVQLGTVEAALNASLQAAVASSGLLNQTLLQARIHCSSCEQISQGCTSLHLSGRIV